MRDVISRSGWPPSRRRQPIRRTNRAPRLHGTTAVSLWSLSAVAMNPPLDVDTLTSVMEKVKAKQEEKPVPCVCPDGNAQAGLVATASPAPGSYTQSCRYFIFPGSG